MKLFNKKHLKQMSNWLFSEILVEIISGYVRWYKILIKYNADLTFLFFTIRWLKRRARFQEANDFCIMRG